MACRSGWNCGLLKTGLPGKVSGEVVMVMQAGQVRFHIGAHSTTSYSMMQCLDTELVGCF